MSTAVTTPEVTVPEIVEEIITPETKVFFRDIPEILGKFDLLTTHYQDQEMIGRGLAMFETHNGVQFINVELEYIAAYGNSTYTKNNHNVIIPPFLGKVALNTLPVQPLFDIDKVDQFVLRGKKFEEITQKPTYKHSTGFMYIPVWGGFKRLPIDSRIVIDPEGYKKYCSADKWHDNETLKIIPDELISFTLPCVPAFSLEYRMWGEIPVDSIKEIVFDETAFQRTVLTDAYKELISTLVTNFYGTECCDFIAGKKRGLVFLLNGPPGVGKTLTAHGIAELTHRPLYTIGSGDIGTHPDQIDKKLQQIFNMVGSWNGIVLIDEADVFMSKRTDYNIEYNACVSVFLRLIETYFGILFLTTNRDHGIDSAFDSRIHIRLRYNELENDEKKKVWAESFNRYKINGIDLDKVCACKLNNREIANIVQLAYIHSNGKPENINQDIIDKFITIRENFNKPT